MEKFNRLFVKSGNYFLYNYKFYMYMSKNYVKAFFKKKKKKNYAFTP